MEGEQIKNGADRSGCLDSRVRVVCRDSGVYVSRYSTLCRLVRDE